MDELEERLVKQLDEVRIERNELAVAERVRQQMSKQLAAERQAAASPTVQVGGRGVLLVPRREPGVAVGGSVTARQVGETLGLDVGVQGKLEPLPGKMTKLADGGWLRKRPDEKFTASL
ncbi:hypothetical protein ACFYZB_33615 [Streptomyces sp. NPDC001852]|uniref:hypothetical protein n=1 Tax=Streptomyces sp. NPDC001852 TaxID=3364619 RepID=UPI00367471D0